MTRFAIDAEVALRIVRGDLSPDPRHQLVAPAMLRSHVLAVLYREVRAGRLDEPTGREQLERLAELKIRLLGDRVSRSVAWKLAARLGWTEVGPAEYLAVATLQADALVTTDELLAEAAREVIPLAAPGDLER